VYLALCPARIWGIIQEQKSIDGYIMHIFIPPRTVGMLRGLFWLILVHQSARRFKGGSDSGLLRVGGGPAVFVVLVTSVTRNPAANPSVSILILGVLLQIKYLTTKAHRSDLTVSLGTPFHKLSFNLKLGKTSFLLHFSGF
jgi:hypothetical protein